MKLKLEQRTRLEMAWTGKSKRTASVCATGAIVSGARCSLRYPFVFFFGFVPCTLCLIFLGLLPRSSGFGR